MCSDQTQGRVPPLCVFYYPAFRVQKENPGDSIDNAIREASRRRAAVRKRLARRTRWRTSSRHPVGCLYSDASTAPPMSQVLNTLTAAWPSPRTCSLDRPMAARPLPKRRYSVPEAVMRRFVLRRCETDGSDSGVATVPLQDSRDNSSSQTVSSSYSSNRPPEDQKSPGTSSRRSSNWKPSSSDFSSNQPYSSASQSSTSSKTSSLSSSQHTSQPTDTSSVPPSTTSYSSSPHPATSSSSSSTNSALQNSQELSSSLENGHQCEPTINDADSSLLTTNCNDNNGLQKYSQSLFNAGLNSVTVYSISNVMFDHNIFSECTVCDYTTTIQTKVPSNSQQNSELTMTNAIENVKSLENINATKSFQELETCLTDNNKHFPNEVIKQLEVESKQHLSKESDIDLPPSENILATFTYLTEICQNLAEVSLSCSECKMQNQQISENNKQLIGSQKTEISHLSGSSQENHFSSAEEIRKSSPVYSSLSSTDSYNIHTSDNEYLSILFQKDKNPVVSVNTGSETSLSDRDSSKTVKKQKSDLKSIHFIHQVGCDKADLTVDVPQSEHIMKSSSPISTELSFSSSGDGDSHIGFMDSLDERTSQILTTADLPKSMEDKCVGTCPQFTEVPVPRYSALPRSISMLVNISADSESSPPDSLEGGHSKAFFIPLGESQDEPKGMPASLEARLIRRHEELKLKRQKRNESIIPSSVKMKCKIDKQQGLLNRKSNLNQNSSSCMLKISKEIDKIEYHKQPVKHPKRKLTPGPGKQPKFSEENIVDLKVPSRILQEIVPINVDDNGFNRKTEENQQISEISLNRNLRRSSIPKIILPEQKIDNKELDKQKVGDIAGTSTFQQHKRCLENNPSLALGRNLKQLSRQNTLRNNRRSTENIILQDLKEITKPKSHNCLNVKDKKENESHFPKVKTVSLQQNKSNIPMKTQNKSSSKTNAKQQLVPESVYKKETMVHKVPLQFANSVLNPNAIPKYPKSHLPVRVQASPQLRRTDKFHKFEAIPEEKSGSLDSPSDENKPLYKGKAALGNADEQDLLSLSKGWLNFYLLKDGNPTDTNTNDEYESEDHLAEKPQEGQYSFQRPSLINVDRLPSSGEFASESSSSDSEGSTPAVLPLKPLRRRRAASHTASSRFTVKVNGPPTLEMRVCFPTCSRRPTANQSDSGLGEDNSNSSGRLLPPAAKWTFTLSQGVSDKAQNSKTESFQCLPELGCQLNNKTGTKSRKNLVNTPLLHDDSIRTRRMSCQWPTSQPIIPLSATSKANQFSSRYMD